MNINLQLLPLFLRSNAAFATAKTRCTQSPPKVLAPRGWSPRRLSGRDETVLTAILLLCATILPTLAAVPVIRPSSGFNSQSVFADASATFTITATGDAPLGYQWRRDGAGLRGETNRTLKIGSTRPADEGGYDVVVSNASGSVTSYVSRLFAVPPTSELIKTNHTNSAGLRLPYFYHLPTGYDPARRYPLILLFTGGGSDETTLFNLLPAQFFVHTSYARQAANPSLVVCVTRRAGDGNDSWTAQYLQQTAVLMDDLLAKFSVDTNRVYVVGSSQGAPAAWDLLRLRPGLFAAAALPSGWKGNALPASIKDVPIRVWHAADDPTVNVSNSRDLVQVLRRAGGRPIYTEFQTGGHAGGIGAGNMSPVIHDWLMAQRRGVPSGQPPRLSITAPGSPDLLVTSSATVNLAGTAESIGETVTRVSWENLTTRAKGDATGTTAWSVAAVPLKGEATNIVVVTATTASGFPVNGGVTTFSDTRSVLVRPPVRADPMFGDAHWSSMGGMAGANDRVAAAVVDGSGNLYIAGWFTVAGEVIANRVAKWNGSRWTALGSGMSGGDFPQVSALAVLDGVLYAGGSFRTAGGIAATNIARWNGSQWTALGSGLSGGDFLSVSALAVSGSTVYAGGAFTNAGGNTAKHIAKWDGSHWTALGSGLNGEVSALAVSGNNLYAGGYFTTAGGIAASGIAKWDGRVWSALGSGLNGEVTSLVVSGGELYVGGYFPTADGITTSGIVKWDGRAWSVLGSGMEGGGVIALAQSGTNLYAGGRFTTEAGSMANYIAKWDGSHWTAVGAGVNYSVHALAVSGNDLYAGGFFSEAGGGPANCIAKWNGSHWSALGSGMSGFYYGSVSALAVSGSELYAGGRFRWTGNTVGSEVNSLARWDGTRWTALGSGVDGDFSSVNALAMSGSDLYAGGSFTTAGGSAATNIASWDGRRWSALGSGLDGGAVTVLAVSGSDLYAGGYFTTAGGSAASFAKWNGSTWTALGSGLGSVPGQTIQVHALAVSGSELYVGGSYITTGGAGAGSAVARWDGSNWMGLGLGRGDERVSSLAITGGKVYAGGNFTQAGGSAANFVAQWDGSTWSSVGLGVDGTVHALAVAGGDLYAATWPTSGGISTGCVAKWDGGAWTVLLSGIGGINALAVSGSDLYTGGYFTTAGGEVSAYVARAYLSALPTLTVLRSGPDVTVSWPAVNTAGFGLEHADSLAAPVIWASHSDSATVTADGAYKSVTLPAGNQPRFFRLRRP